jgi:hypothetical protein
MVSASTSGWRRCSSAGPHQSAGQPWGKAAVAPAGAHDGSRPAAGGTQWLLRGSAATTAAAARATARARPSGGAYAAGGRSRESWLASSMVCGTMLCQYMGPPGWPPIAAAPIMLAGSFESGTGAT